jgi:hypothetical protein
MAALVQQPLSGVLQPQLEVELVHDVATGNVWLWEPLTEEPLRF